jgi:hypothetical protein
VCVCARKSEKEREREREREKRERDRQTERQREEKNKKIGEEICIGISVARQQAGVVLNAITHEKAALIQP